MHAHQIRTLNAHARTRRVFGHDGYERLEAMERSTKMEFFKSTDTFHALGWNLAETAFYWQHKNNHKVVGVHVEKLVGVAQSELEHKIAVKRSAAKAIKAYDLSREGATENLAEFKQTLHLMEQVQGVEPIEPEDQDAAPPPPPPAAAGGIKLILADTVALPRLCVAVQADACVPGNAGATVRLPAAIAV